MRLLVPALAVFGLLILIPGGCTTSLGGDSSLKKEVETLRRELDNLKNQNRLDELKGESETTALKAEVERLSAELETMNTRLKKNDEPAQNQGAAPPAARTEQPPAPPEPAAKGLYEEGKLLFDRKDYRQAAELFRNYLREDPKGANAAAAQFYIGESLYSEKRYEEAILEYQKVVEGFPKSSQVPTTLLKQGLSFQALGDGGSAKLL
jgi:tol-pal system protein YbgF